VSAAAWLAAHLMSPSPVAPGALALASWVLVAALPRTGWLLAGAAVAGAVAIDGRPGSALVVAGAALTPVVLLPRRPLLWPAAALAPGLGAIGLAGAWPALAGAARTTAQRAGLAGAGFLWLVAASCLSGQALYVHPPPGSHPASAWAGSPHSALHHALGTIFSARSLAPAAVWALGAALLPALRRPGLTPVALALTAAWATATATATLAALRYGSGWDPGISVAPLIGGAVAAAAIALAFRIRLRRAPRRLRTEQPLRLP